VKKKKFAGGRLIVGKPLGKAILETSAELQREPTKKENSKSCRPKLKGKRGGWNVCLRRWRGNRGLRGGGNVTH